MHTQFGSENLNGRALGRPMRRQEDNVRMDLRGTGWEVVWTGFIWLSLWINGGILRTR